MPNRRPFMAPNRYARNAGQCADGWRDYWRELRSAVVPTPGYRLEDLVYNNYSQQLSGTANFDVVSESRGRALRIAFGAGAATLSQTLIPQTAPMSVFTLIVPRTVTGTQSLCSTHQASGSGWSFRLTQTTNTLGFTRWGIADEPSTSFGTTSGTENAVGFTLDGTTLRYFLNGRFQNKASGQPTSNSASPWCVGGDATATILDTSMYVLYCWGRVLADEEMLALYRDPWGPIRPRKRTRLGDPSQSRTMASAVSTWTAVTPSLVANANLSPATAVSTWTVPTPGLTGDSFLTPATATSTWTVNSGVFASETVDAFAGQVYPS